jgi:predicted RNA-binding protein with TRAM domain
MAVYTWLLGIDWNAVQTGGVSYLRGGLLAGEAASPGTNPVEVNDKVTFVILDVTSSGGKKVAEIGSFVILTQAAVTGQTLNKGLSSLQPTVTLDATTVTSTIFPNALGSWSSGQVTVTRIRPGETAEPSVNTFSRFLLTTQVQAIGTDGVVRFFSHDPEMIVGPNG